MELNMEECKKAYVKMVQDARFSTFSKIKNYLSINGYMTTPKDGLLMKFAKKLDTIIYKYDNDYWKQFDEERTRSYYNKPDNVCYVANAMSKKNPEFKKQVYGLNDLYTCLSIMDGVAKYIHPKSLLDTLRDFCEIYSTNPDISDVDLMVRYLKDYSTLKNIRALDTIPQEVRDNLDLGIKENMGAYIQQYAKEYLHEELAVGGKGL